MLSYNLKFQWKLATKSEHIGEEDLITAMLRVTCVIAAFLAVVTATSPPQGHSAFVNCDLVASTNSTVYGNVYLSSLFHNETIQILGVIGGLAPGKHGVHIHRDGATGNDCKDAGPHFNPSNAPHGAPGDHESKRHAGDLGNFDVDQRGVLFLDFKTEQISLTESSPLSVVNRTLVVHALPDDLGRGGDEESTKTGNAGARLACCRLVAVTKS